MEICIQVVEEFRTRWRTISSVRLRQCTECQTLFPSFGAEERFCDKCSKSIAEARARPYIEREEDIKQYLESFFDQEYVDKVEASAKWRNEQRLLRIRR